MGYVNSGVSFFSFSLIKTISKCSLSTFLGEMRSSDSIREGVELRLPGDQI